MSKEETPVTSFAADDAGYSDFIRQAVKEDLESGRFDHVHTRFPPEPNGYLHIGHAKAICIDYGIAEEFGGVYNLRFDDTNPVKEEEEYVDAIKEDIRWLGYEWGDRLFYASDYFETLYEYAERLIKKGKAYICDLSADEVREYRGTLTEAGKDSPYRNRPIEENLDLFRRMRAGEFPDGSKTLRAKINMASGNINLRDPVMYRILHASHHRTGDAWCIYPMYDFAHGQSDSIEGITHSLCSLEYESHRPLYDWFVKELEIYAPRQMEFARLNLSYTVMSKRKLLELVKKGFVRGWDDPRMPTLSGLRRRGYTPESIKRFCSRIGVAKKNSLVDFALLESILREDLNKTAPRMMAVLNPLKVVITNYPEGKTENVVCENNPEDPLAGTRTVPFEREIYIERDDFIEDPPKKYFRLYPGNEVRLKHAYYITCAGVIKDDKGEIKEVHCTYDPETRGGDSPDRRRVKGTLHWVTVGKSVPAEIRLYSRLFSVPVPEEVEAGKEFTETIDPNSLTVISNARVEAALKEASKGTRYQFLRQGYFVSDPDSTPEKPVFNRIVTLQDSWAKIMAKGKENE